MTVCSAPNATTLHWQVPPHGGRTHAQAAERGRLTGRANFTEGSVEPVCVTEEGGAALMESHMRPHGTAFLRRVKMVEGPDSNRLRWPQRGGRQRYSLLS